MATRTSPWRSWRGVGALPETFRLGCHRRVVPFQFSYCVLSPRASLTHGQAPCVTRRTHASTLLAQARAVIYGTVFRPLLFTHTDGRSVPSRQGAWIWCIFGPKKVCSKTGLAGHDKRTPPRRRDPLVRSAFLSIPAIPQFTALPWIWSHTE